MFTGWLTCNKDFKRFLRLQKRSNKKITKELDILRFIRNKRFTAASLYGLLTRSQYKFSEKLADEMLSEYSTPFSSEKDSEKEFFVPPKPTIWGTHPKELDFLDKVIASKNETDKRLVHIYERQEVCRT